ncbi:pyridoxamine 5'-phosphate oxidase family protein [Streptomyces oceani]|uniref:Pyridoxamine 5'-phosphate oxidase n=1 Tax=Streptomyces oceani TaxID=1075402 RepID=A0A1E7KJR8_9ACTN|nr:pyridoxamine 5'-phosphate oxidase family protein [Streptomyces oceani]OEV04209.1 pyridoxamine 5'-phosphate oxidase [Streptomyces oceani]
MTISWKDVEAAQPAHAAIVRERFDAHKHHVLGTLRADGSPRLTVLEADFSRGELWLGMMPNSRKALDLRRDPRFTLHANPGDGSEMEGGGGDVRISGRAIEVTDEAELARFAAAAPEGAVPDVFHLFRADVTEVVRVYLSIPDICTDVWRPGGRLRTLRRGNGDEPPREDPPREG